MSTDKSFNEIFFGKSNKQQEDVEQTAFTKDSSKYKIYKTIYAKKKGTFDNNMLKKVLALEIQQHLSKHSDVLFGTVGEPIKNDDRSYTYPLLFVAKPLE